MHNLGIVHRDIKSHNVLIDDNLNVKVCDFGLAKFMVSIKLFVLMIKIKIRNIIKHLFSQEFPKNIFKSWSIVNFNR